MSHEQSITFPIRQGPNKGLWVNTVGIIGGKVINEDEAHDLILSGYLLPLGDKYYKTQEEAERAAIRRSKSFDNKVPDFIVRQQRVR